MKIENIIRDEKIQFGINREAAKTSALSSALLSIKIDKYEYLTGDEILISNSSRMIEQAKFNYFPLGKAFEKEIKKIEDQGRKQVENLQVLKTYV